MSGIGDYGRANREVGALNIEERKIKIGLEDGSIMTANMIKEKTKELQKSREHKFKEIQNNDMYKRNPDESLVHKWTDTMNLYFNPPPNARLKQVTSILIMKNKTIDKLHNCLLL